MTTRKSSSETMSSAKRLDTIQRNIYIPLLKQKMSIASSANYTNEENYVQPKILNLNNDMEVKTEFLRSKRSFIAAGPPLLKDKPTTEEFYDWKILIIQYLEFLPGYQAGMLVIQPNLENMTEDDLKFTTENYELIYNSLSKATIGNKLVRLKISAISRLPVWDLVAWWSTVAYIFLGLAAASRHDGICRGRGRGKP